MSNSIYKVGIVMEPLDSVNKALNSSYAIVIEGLRREHEIYWIDPEYVSYENLRIVAVSRKLTFDLDRKLKMLDRTSIDPENLDILIFRVDPPIDMSYIALNVIFSRLNNPMILSSWESLCITPEKLPAFELEKYMPDFIVSKQLEQILKFCRDYKSIILKPLYDFQGNNIIKIDAANPNLKAIINLLLSKYSVPIIAQKFIDNVTDGVIRVLIVGNRFYGGLNIKPLDGHFRAFTGGKESFIELSSIQKEIAMKTIQILKSKKILVGGLDFIGDKLIEVNVASPGCIARFNDLLGINIASTYWETLESMMLIHKKT